MQRIRAVTVAQAVALLLVASALALTGNELLQKAQEAMRPGEDMTSKDRMTVTSADGQTDVMEMMAYQKDDRTLMRITAPEEFAGIAVLILPREEGGEEIWLYLPAFRDVKQIVAEGLSEGFIGSDFAYEDLTVSYSDKYDVTEMAEESDRYVLSLTPKPDAGISYSGARLWVDKETFLPTRAEFDRQGQLLKVMTLSDVRTFSSTADPQASYPTPTRIEMANVKTGSKTVIELLEVEFDTGLEDDFFTVRKLKRGR